MKKAIVIGSGAGGATAAKELQGEYAVTVLEAGVSFQPFAWNLSFLEKLRGSGLLFDEREIQLIFPAMSLRKTRERLVLVRGRGLGGTTTLSAGNALRADQSLRALGIDLDREFDELYHEVPVTYEHRHLWSKATKKLFAICHDMGLNPQPLPKLGDYRYCRNCGRCVLGCRYGVKWDSRRFLEQAKENGARIVTGCEAGDVVIREGRAIGVRARRGRHYEFHEADLVVLAAGGLGTAALLRRSGIPCGDNLFVDPVLCVAALQRDTRQNKELSMPFAVQRSDYILSPYFDHLSFFFNAAWRHSSQDILALMIKLADTSEGQVSVKHVKKSLTAVDHHRLKEGVADCMHILERYGVRREEVFLGTLNAGHPGGTLPLTVHEAHGLHHDILPANLYVADASLLPKALGNPPILTIMALAKKVCAAIKNTSL